MTELNPYLSFSGTCREALEFYQDCFGGDIVTMQTYEEVHLPTDDAYKHYIVHSALRAGDIYFMASDSRPGEAVAVGNHIALSLNFANVSDQARIFAALARGGTITLPLEDTFWGAKFGMVTDRYGIGWLLNCEKK